MNPAATKAGAGASVVLKVDVDTAVGLKDGVRRLADIMRTLGLRASYFIAMGPDHSGRALRRLAKPGFLQKQLRSGAAGAYGPLTMLYGLLLPGPVIGRQAPGLFNRLIGEGHEVGLHGWDHVHWHDHLVKMTPSQVRMELGQAWGLFRQLTGMAPAGFAAPGWQITDQAYLALCELGISHVSCTRGEGPFRPLVEGRALPILELPTTMPSLDEVLGRAGVDQDNAGDYLASLVRPGRLNVFTMHAEVEGRAMLPAFTRFCRRLQKRGARFITLAQAAREALASGPVPTGRVVMGPVAGRAGEVAWQAAPERAT